MITGGAPDRWECKCVHTIVFRRTYAFILGVYVYTFRTSEFMYILFYYFDIYMISVNKVWTYTSYYKVCKKKVCKYIFVLYFYIII